MAVWRPARAVASGEPVRRGPVSGGNGANGRFSRTSNWSCTGGDGQPRRRLLLRFVDDDQWADGTYADCSLGSSAIGRELDHHPERVHLDLRAPASASHRGRLDAVDRRVRRRAGNITVGSLVLGGGRSPAARGRWASRDLTMTAGTFTGRPGSVTVGGNVNVSATVTNGGDPTLVGYWAFDDTPNHTADSSGNGNSLTWSGGPTFPSTSLPTVSFTDTYAVSMTGTRSPVRRAGLSGISELRPSTVTVSAWYKATSTDTTAGEIVSGSNTYGLRITTTGADRHEADRQQQHATARLDRVPRAVLERAGRQLAPDRRRHRRRGPAAACPLTSTAWSPPAPTGSTAATAPRSSTAPRPDGHRGAPQAADRLEAPHTETLRPGHRQQPVDDRLPLRGRGSACSPADLRHRRRARLQPRADRRRGRRAVARQSAGRSSRGVLTLAGAMTVTGERDDPVDRDADAGEREQPGASAG